MATAPGSGDAGRMNTFAKVQPAVEQDTRPIVPGITVTRAGERHLRAELSRLQNVLAVDMAERLREARSFGAPADNDDYLQIQEEQAVLAGRAARLENLLASARVLDGGASNGLASVGTVVEVQDIDNKKVFEYRLSGGYERSAPNVVSADSPVGRALMGRAAGAVVDVQVPSGRRRTLEILAIRALGD